MSNCSLTLIPFGKQPFTIGLLENDERQLEMERSIENTGEVNSIFSDLSYEFSLENACTVEVRDVKVYINDIFEPSIYSEGRISFPSSGGGVRKIFLDWYGFVQLTFRLLLNDVCELCLVSNYLPVLVKRGELNDSVKAMVKYVYTHQEKLLINSEPKSRDLSGLKERGYQTLSAQIILAEEIASIYESSYSYFKANARVKIDKTPTIDYLEKLQVISPATLQYITSHPEQLRQVNSITGIRVGNRIYQPQKTLSLKNTFSYNLYENKVVLGFLRRMVDNVLEMREQCDALIRKIPCEEEYSSEYIYSSYFMFAETRRTLESARDQLLQLYNKFAQLLGMYINIFPIKVDVINSKPHSTPVFMAVPQYHKVFVRIHQWFSYGIYDYARENFMLSFMKISSLYESYLLTKMISYLLDRGYNLMDSKKFEYSTYTGMKYKNTLCRNTFAFSNSDYKITLYFQPVIFRSSRHLQNGIGLYRNNSIPVSLGDETESEGAPYYCPDFLIKYESNMGTKYVVADAKFSKYTQVRKLQIKDLAFKYLFSLSPVDRSDRIVGLCVIYGKCIEGENTKSAYNWEIKGGEIKPFADMLPMLEGVDTESHYTKLDQLFERIEAQ